MYPFYNPNQNQVFKARKNRYEEEFQEEEYEGEEYNENNEQYQEGTQNQLRAKPILVPRGRVVPPPRQVIPPYGYVPVPKTLVIPMPGIGVKRGPLTKVVGYNIFQPKVVSGYGYRGIRPTSYHHGPRRGFEPPQPIFRLDQEVIIFMKGMMMSKFMKKNINVIHVYVIKVENNFKINISNWLISFINH